jgi:histidinol phosphatase-like enzyme (inositol monophosphatase family)
MNGPTVDQPTLDRAVSIIRAAGELTLRWFRQIELDIEHKADGSPVTAADKAAERYVREQLREAFPHDTICGEEEDDEPGTSGRRWIIDPIDGTKAFTHGVPLYCNLLSLEDEAGPAIGIINVPAIGELVAAGRGLGATLNGVPCRVSQRQETPKSLLTTSAITAWDPDAIGRVQQAGMRMRTWGDGFGYVLVASGRAESMVDLGDFSIWDIAPARVIIPEAGGRVTDQAGRDLSSGPATANGSFIASNGLLHDRVLEILNG